MIKQNHSSFTAVVTMLVVLLGCGIASEVEAKEKSHNKAYVSHHKKHVKHNNKQRNIVKDKKAKLSNSTSHHNGKGSTSSKGYTTTGVASWYGPGFHGRKTASGEKFNMYALTAAHKTLPLHSRVRVTNLKTHKSVIVKINDRGPYVGNRKIDLSLASARAIGLNGTAKVEMVVL